MAAKRDYYETLGVNKSADKEAIKRHKGVAAHGCTMAPETKTDVFPDHHPRLSRRDSAGRAAADAARVQPARRRDAVF